MSLDLQHIKQLARNISLVENEANGYKSLLQNLQIKGGIWKSVKGMIMSITELGLKGVGQRLLMHIELGANKQE